jgi:hypothetical protein
VFLVKLKYNIKYEMEMRKKKGRRRERKNHIFVLELPILFCFIITFPPTNSITN